MAPSPWRQRSHYRARWGRVNGGAYFAKRRQARRANARSEIVPMPRPRKHQCPHSENTSAYTQKPQCLRPKTPMPRSQKPQCLRAETPLPGHPMWPRPSAYTREFRKLTCVGTGPRPSCNVRIHICGRKRGNDQRRVRPAGSNSKVTASDDGRVAQAVVDARVLTLTFLNFFFVLLVIMK